MVFTKEDAFLLSMSTGFMLNNSLWSFHPVSYKEITHYSLSLKTDDFKFKYELLSESEK